MYLSRNLSDARILQMHMTSDSHIDLESAKNCQILAWETCNVYINCDINSNHDSTIPTIPIKIDKRVSVIFNTYFNKNF